MRILVDMDGVIADYEWRFLQLWRARYPNKPYIPLAQRKAYDVSDDMPGQYRPYIQEIKRTPGFFLSLPKIDGAEVALNDMRNLGIDVFICTACRSAYTECLLEKYLWIEQELGEWWLTRLLITSDKTIINADYLIDDRPEIVGIDTPVWEHLVFDQPYNRLVGDKTRLDWSNWKSVILTAKATKKGDGTN